MKRIQLVILSLVFSFCLIAQEQGKIRVGFDLGAGLANMGGGFGGAIDFRYNVADNINVGLKSTSAILLKDIDDQVTKVTSGIVSSVYGIGDYYFNNGVSSFAPFVGAGLGSSKILNISIDANSAGSTPSAGFAFDRKFSGVIRGGFEAGHFRMAMDLYIIPRSNLYDINNVLLGTSANTYGCLSIGFYLGGGKWRKL